jgi:hypothetical protein
MVRHSGALAIALLAFTFSGSHVVRAQDPEVSTPSLSEMVFAPIMKAVEGIEQRLSNMEATWGLFKASFSSDHMVTRQLCIADESGAQTCITKAQLDVVLASMTRAEAPAPTETIKTETIKEAATETPVVEPAIVAEAEAEPELAAQSSADPVVSAEPVVLAEPVVSAEPVVLAEPIVSTEPVVNAAEATTPTITEQVEVKLENSEPEHTGSLPEPGAARISYPEVEVTIP